MTMDIRRPVSESSQHGSTEDQILASSKSVKRPFDVAFLMLPDEKLKHRQVIYGNDNSRTTEVDDKPPESTIRVKNHAKFFQKQHVFDDPNSIKSRLLQEEQGSPQPEQKSAFTKVNLLPKESRASPHHSISPDLSYQSSLSPSPPVSNRSYPSILSPTQIFKPAYHTNFIQDFVPPNSSSLDNPFLHKAHHPQHSTDILQTPNFAVKMRPLLTPQYRPDMSHYAYHPTQFQPTPDMLKPELSKFPPAAAILSTLLPPSLAALSLPAQNVCAKCNVSFRMTSDLVYHMRSHHKNEGLDVTRKRREDKLKCPVCAESFRERHHLTRHMTAHQDKDDDEEQETKMAKKKAFTGYAK